MKYILLFVAFAITGGQTGAQNVLKIEAGAVLKTTGGAVITLQDMNLQNDGTINQAPGEGTFRFTGTANTTISGTSAPLIDIFEIAKAGTAKVSLQRSINIGSGITFTSGLIDLNNNTILLSPAALLNGESETSSITGANGGFVEITNTLNAPSSANPGNLGAIISSGANMGSTVIRRGHQSQVNGSGAGNSILRYYDIIPTNNSTLNATLRFKYLDAELNGLTENVLVMWKSSNNISWAVQGFTSRDIATNYVEKTGIADFSRWTLSSPGNALPVLFILFNVKCNTDKVEVNWKTASEQNSSHFEAQRSENGINWAAIGRVAAAGNSGTEKSYSFTDNNPSAGIAFYRIAEFDIDGRVQYTSVLKNECGQPDIFKVWPNPVQRELFANISTAGGSQAVVKVFDSKGALVREQRNTLLPGNNQLSIDMRNLTPGIYHVLVKWGSNKMQQAVKIIKQ